MQLAWWSLVTGATLAWAQRPAQPQDPLSRVCPVQTCNAGGVANIPLGSAQVGVTGPCPGGVGVGAAPGGGGGALAFDVAFKPAHFTCRLCDASICEGCALLCDLKQCVGEFYREECWCEESGRSSSSKIHKVFCDGDCMGGVCDTLGFRCKKRSAACKPWWWCGPLPGGQEFLQRGAREQRHSRLRLREKTADTATDRGRVRGLGAVNQTITTELNFQMSRFTCESAALPPQVWDQQHFQYVDRGYIIFDKRACEGSLFNKACYCWDSFLYLSGEDPLTSQMKCDPECKWGGCAGKTCALHPPPPLSQSTPPPGALPEAKPRQGGLVMEPMDQLAVAGR